MAPPTTSWSTASGPAPVLARLPSVYTVGDPVPLTVTINSDFPNPPAGSAGFYANGNLFATLAAPPYTAIATNLPAGTNTLYVIVNDSTGAPIKSPEVKVFVQRIGVTLLTPFEDTMFLSANPITITAWGYLPSGTISSVDFLVDGVKVAESTATPFSGIWATPTGGSHRLTAIGTSDTGAKFTSQPVNIGVATTLVATGAVWKYLDNGSDQGPAWQASNFDDSSWASGPAELGYGDGDEATVVNSGPANAFFITTYFRQGFEISPAALAGAASITASLERDDAAVLYLNGREVFRSSNLPAAPAPITFDLVATGQAVEDTIDTFQIDPTNFVAGLNVFAVEIHQQAANSSDISFNFGLQAIPTIIHNLSPVVNVTTPTNSQSFLAPTSLELSATAVDNDGTISRVEFLVDGTKVGEDSDPPYAAIWTNPTRGPHTITAVGIDDQNGSGTSSPIDVVVYDAVGTPFGKITAPADGSRIEGGTNIVLTAYANSPTGVSRVEFYSNGTLIGSDDSSPYGIVWNAPFGDNTLTVVVDNGLLRGTSAPVTLTAYPNTTAPTVATQTPAAGSTVTNLTSIAVTFSEPVHLVDATDLLVNGVPAERVTGSGTRYVFSFAQPPYGPVQITWDRDDDIFDFGYPADLPFDGTAPTAVWNYLLLDRTPPVVTVTSPATGALVNVLQEVTVNFSEPVSGVDASDLIVSGTPAFAVSGSGNSYTFLVSQPAFGTVNVTWATNNGIVDLSDAPNAFVGSQGGWSFTLDYRTTLIASNSVWDYFEGEGEPSTPVSLWRQREYELEDEWHRGPAPFFFGDPYTNASIAGTYLSEMLSNYTTIYLRQEFVVTNRAAFTNLFLAHQIDDGLIAWLNGVEVLRVNAPSGQVPYNGVATVQANEPNNAGAAYIVASLGNAYTNLVNGTNVLAVHALNQSLTSSDFGFNATLYTYFVDPTLIAPRIVTATPAGGDRLFLTNIVVQFSEGVSGVDASDLLINGVPATTLVNDGNTTFSFGFAQPAYGPVNVTWAPGHGIADFDTPPKPFDATATNATIHFELFNPAIPRVATQVPAAGLLITGLTQITITFTKPVANVDATDLLLNGTPALSVTSTDATTYRFAVTQPDYGSVQVRWDPNHGIVDLETGTLAFDPSRFGGQWTYNLVSPIPVVSLTSPANNASVLSPVTVRATANDGDGFIARVEFYNQNGKIGEATQAPYVFNWETDQGPFTLRAVATDNNGLSATSAPVSITVVTSLPIVLVRGPYLQMGTPTSSTIRWRSDLFSDAVVYYGADADHLTNYVVRTSRTNEHIVAINGLDPDTKYFYSIGNSAQRLAQGTNYWFQTSPVAGSRKPTRVWLLGDAGTAANGSPDRQQSTRDAFNNFAATNGGPTDLMLLLGDNAYNSGTDSEYQTAIFDMYPTTLRNKFVWPTIGNHETSQATEATDFPYLHIFSLPQQGEAGGIASGTEKYYSFDYANIHFVCLDSMSSGRGSDTPMAQWLRTDLEATAQDWIIVFFHHSLYTKGTHDSDSEPDLVELRQNIIPILESHGVDLVLMGHSHVYERSYLLDGHYGLSSTLTSAMKIDPGSGRENDTGAYQKNLQGRGVVYTIAGSAGQALGGQLNMPAHFVSLNELGTVILDVNSNRLDAKFLNSSAVVRDFYTVIKPTAPPTPASLVARGLDAGRVELAWSDVGTNELGYVIERSANGVEFERVATNTVDVTVAVDAGLLANTTYYYRVRSYNERGESAPSLVAAATTVDPTGAPNAPGALVVASENAGRAYRSQLFLRWQDTSSNESAFLIERSRDGAPFVPVTTVGANVTSFIDTGLDSATWYFYRVSSMNGAGQTAGADEGVAETHPHGAVVTEGEPIVLHGGVDGVAPIRYQWSRQGVPIPGATDESLVIPSASSLDEAAYTVRVADATGSTETNPAWVFVLLPPHIVLQPSSSTNILGGVQTFAVQATGTDPLFYQWRKNGVNLPGAHDDHLTLNALSYDDRGDYDVVVMNEYGSVVSASAQLLVTGNRKPILTPLLARYDLEILRRLSITNAATDPDETDQLTFSLDPGAPTNAVIDPHTGVFRWRPTREQASSTNWITIRVNDHGVPDLSDSSTIAVVVNSYLEVSAGSALVQAGTTTNEISIEVRSSAPWRELQVMLETPPADLLNLSLESSQPLSISPALADAGASGQRWMTFTGTNGWISQGTQQVARLKFTAGANSSFAPVRLSPGSATLDDSGGLPTLLSNEGRVIIIGAQPLLEATLAAGNQRQLILYGQVGSTVTIQSKTTATGAWANRSSVVLTNQIRAVAPPSATAPLIFYRLRQ